MVSGVLILLIQLIGKDLDIQFSFTLVEKGMLKVGVSIGHGAENMPLNLTLYVLYLSIDFTVKVNLLDLKTQRNMKRNCSRQVKL